MSSQKDWKGAIKMWFDEIKDMNGGVENFRSGQKKNNNPIVMLIITATLFQSVN